MMPSRDNKGSTPPPTQPFPTTLHEQYTPRWEAANKRYSQIIHYAVGLLRDFETAVVVAEPLQ